MAPDAKRHFLECHSLAEMAITLVILGVMFLLPTAFLSVLLTLVLGLSENIALLVSIILWLRRSFITRASPT